MNDLLYVCSPYRGDTKRNKEYARKLTRAAINNGFVPVTVHLYLTEVTDDQNPEERSRGMAADIWWTAGKKPQEDKTMNEAQRMAEVEKFKNYFSYINRPGADKLLAWLEEAGFFTAPASTKYHGAYAGGLVEHTNHVYRRLVRLADEEDKRQGRTYPEYTVDTIAVAALLHDVCKVDAYKVEKKNQKQKDGSWKEVEVYGYTNSLPLGHGEKSIIQIMRYMQLTEEEMLAIRWHMGAFDSAVKGGSYDMNNAFAGSRLAAMLHIADMMATHLDERTNANE